MALLSKFICNRSLRRYLLRLEVYLTRENNGWDDCGDVYVDGEGKI